MRPSFYGSPPHSQYSTADNLAAPPSLRAPGRTARPAYGEAAGLAVDSEMRSMPKGVRPSFYSRSSPLVADTAGSPSSGSTSMSGRLTAGLPRRSFYDRGRPVQWVLPATPEFPQDDDRPTPSTSSRSQEPRKESPRCHPSTSSTSTAAHSDHLPEEVLRRTVDADTETANSVSSGCANFSHDEIASEPSDVIIHCSDMREKKVDEDLHVDGASDAVNSYDTEVHDEEHRTEAESASGVPVASSREDLKEDFGGICEQDESEADTARSPDDDSTRHCDEAVDAAESVASAAVPKALPVDAKKGWLRLSGNRRWADSEPEDGSDDGDLIFDGGTAMLCSRSRGLVSATASTMGSDSPDAASQPTDEALHVEDVTPSWRVPHEWEAEWQHRPEWYSGWAGWHQTDWQQWRQGTSQNRSDRGKRLSQRRRRRGY